MKPTVRVKDGVVRFTIGAQTFELWAGDDDDKERPAASWYAAQLRKAFKNLQPHTVKVGGMTLAVADEAAAKKLLGLHALTKAERAVVKAAWRWCRIDSTTRDEEKLVLSVQALEKERTRAKGKR